MYKIGTRYMFSHNNIQGQLIEIFKNGDIKLLTDDNMEIIGPAWRAWQVVR